MHLRQALYKLATRYGEGVVEFSTDDSGWIHAKVDEILFRFKESEQRVYMHGFVCCYPKQHLEGVLGALLHANFFGQGTNGAHFGVDRKNQEILFCRFFAMKKVSTKLFLLAVEDACEQIRAWRSRIRQLEKFGKMVPDTAVDYFWKKI